MLKLTPAIVYSIAPMAKSEYVNALVSYQHLFVDFGITTAETMSRFLGQIMHETQGLTRLEENLYYTSVARLRAVWPSRFKSNAAALPYLRNPRALANLVYGGRLGNIGPDDGWMYRGSGTPHLTGRNNYQMVTDQTGQNVVKNPDAVRVFPMALTAGLVFWHVNNLKRFTDIKALTKAWQGADGGLSDRITYTNRAAKALAGQATDAPQSKAGTMILRKSPTYSDAVKELQRRLKSLGYEVGLVDGFYGDATERAVQDFQRVYGLIADGVFGPATEAALLVALNGGKGKNPDQPSGLNNFLSWLIGLFSRA